MCVYPPPFKTEGTWGRTTTFTEKTRIETKVKIKAEVSEERGSAVPHNDQDYGLSLKKSPVSNQNAFCRCYKDCGEGES